MIDGLIQEHLIQNVPDENVAVLLSGGLDSFSLAVSAHRVGKKVFAYTFTVDGVETRDSRDAIRFAEVFGWEIKVVDVKTENLVGTYKHLLRKYFCFRKTHIECVFPFLSVFPAIEEKYVLSGWGADGWYGIGDKTKRLRNHKEKFDEKRQDYFIPNGGGGFLQMERLAKEHNKVFVAPYITDERIQTYFLSKDYYQLNDGVAVGGSKEKCLTRAAYKKEIEMVGRITRHQNLQKGSGVSDAFERLLDDPEFNTKNYQGKNKIGRIAAMTSLAKQKVKEMEEDFDEWSVNWNDADISIWVNLVSKSTDWEEFEDYTDI